MTTGRPANAPAPDRPAGQPAEGGRPSGPACEVRPEETPAGPERPAEMDLPAEADPTMVLQVVAPVPSSTANAAGLAGLDAAAAGGDGGPGLAPGTNRAPGLTIGAAGLTTPGVGGAVVSSQRAKRAEQALLETAVTAGARTQAVSPGERHAGATIEAAAADPGPSAATAPPASQRLSGAAGQPASATGQTPVTRREPAAARQGSPGPGLDLPTGGAGRGSDPLAMPAGLAVERRAQAAANGSAADAGALRNNPQAPAQDAALVDTSVPAAGQAAGTPEPHEPAVRAASSPVRGTTATAGTRGRSSAAMQTGDQAAPAAAGAARETVTPSQPGTAPGTASPASGPANFSGATPAMPTTPAVAGAAKADAASPEPAGWPVAGSNLLAGVVPPEVSQVIMARLIQAVRRGERECRLELYPAELGHVQARLAFAGDRLSLFLGVDTAQAHAVLQDALPELRLGLEARGLTVGQCQVGFAGANQGWAGSQGSHGSQQWQQPWRDAPPARLPAGRPETGRLPLRSATRQRTANSVDLMI